MLCGNCLNLDSNGNGVFCMVSDCGCSLLLPKVECPNYEPRPNYKSVKWVLQSLDLMACHVVVRRRGKGFGDIEMLGGGSVASVISRFGNLIVKNTDVIDGILFLYVK